MLMCPSCAMLRGSAHEGIREKYGEQEQEEIKIQQENDAYEPS